MFNLRVIFFPAVLVAAFFISFQFSKPLFDEAINLKNKKVPELKVVLDQEQDLKQRSERLFNEASVADGTGSRVLKAIPENKEVKNLIFQIDSIVKKEGLTLKSLKVDEEEDALQAMTGIIQSGGRAFKSVKGSIEVSGSYSKFKTLLKDFNKLDRITNVEGISLSSDTDETEGAVIGKYTIEFSAFWQPLVSAASAKAGLESKESF